ncbi:MAG: hypothetical protein Q4C29_01240 [bacterium]|nr:hypothetical protein [bacterium]
MEKIIKVSFIIVFFSIILIIGVGTLFNNDKVSNLEKRNLTTYPQINKKSIFSDKFYNDLTTAHSDQLQFRNYLVKGYFLFQFQRYYGDVVKGSDNQLYSSSMKTPDETYYKNLSKTIERLNEETKKISAKFIFLSIPRKDAYMKNELPKNYNSSYDIYKKQVETVKSALDNNIIFIDAYDVFSKSGTYNCYYSNDHHITPRCAYTLYNEINKYTNVTSYNLEDEFTIHKVILNGAFSRQLGQSVRGKLEDLYLTSNKKITYTRYEDGNLSKKKVYGKGNDYESAYMEGDNAYTVIDTNVNNDKRIMFVGSSFTNILEALAVPSYEKMVSVDYRHNKTGNSIEYYVKENNIDYVVFIPSQSNNAFQISRILEHLGLSK